MASVVGECEWCDGRGLVPLYNGACMECHTALKKERADSEAFDMAVMGHSKWVLRELHTCPVETLRIIARALRVKKRSTYSKDELVVVLIKKYNAIADRIQYLCKETVAFEIRKIMRG